MPETLAIPDPQQIRELAYQLWEEEGRPEGRERENWLEAEARLRARYQIPHPIAFCEFLVCIPRTAVPDFTKVFCPTPALGHVTVISSQLAPAPPAHGEPAMLLESLGHDSRVVLVELTTATAMLDRIARLAEYVAEWVAFENPPSEVFLESDPSGGPPRLTLPYIKALLREPAPHAPMIDEIDRAISNYPNARFVTFDVTGISLESPVTVRGTAKVFSTAAVLSSIVLFFGGIAEKSAEQVGEAAIKIYQSSRESLQKHQDEIARQLTADMAERRIKVMQTCLADLGYDPGPHDGIFGPRTQVALLQFCQREHVPYDWPHGKATIMHLARMVARRIPY